MCSFHRDICGGHYNQTLLLCQKTEYGAEERRITWIYRNTSIRKKILTEMDVKTITIRMYTCFLAYLISAFFKCFVSAEGVYRWYYQYRGIDISKRFVPLLVLAVIH